MASATWGKITSAEGLHDWGRRAVPLLNYTLAFALQLGKNTEMDTPSIPSICLPGHRTHGWTRANRSQWADDDEDRDSSRNVCFCLQPIDATVCPRRFY
jgi:hypothetical protein